MILQKVELLEREKVIEDIEEQIKKKAEYTQIKQTEDNPTKIIQPLDFEDQSLFEPVNMRRIWRNKLYGEYNPDKPELRDYDKL